MGCYKLSIAEKLVAPSSKEVKMIKAVIFDFWGTLMEIGVFPSPVKQVKYILRLDMPFQDYIVRFEKAFMLNKFDNITEAFENVCKEFDVKPPKFIIDKLVGMWNKNTLLSKPFLDTFPSLDAIKKKKLKIALISNTDSISIEPLLEKFELRKYFDIVVLSYETGKLKTDPDMYKLCLKKLKVKKNEAIVIGDSIQSDIKGAEAAGIKAILLDRKNRLEYENKIVSLKEIESHLK